MPETVPQSRVIWRHPKGRFDVIERTGMNLFGERFCIREAVFTPYQDARGVAHKDSAPDENKMERKNTARKHGYTRIGIAEGEAIRQMLESGFAIYRIANELGGNPSSIRSYAARHRLKKKTLPRDGNPEGSM